MIDIVPTKQLYIMAIRRLLETLQPEDVAELMDKETKEVSALEVELIRQQLNRVAVDAYRNASLWPLVVEMNAALEYVSSRVAKGNDSLSSAIREVVKLPVNRTRLVRRHNEALVRSVTAHHAEDNPCPECGETIKYHIVFRQEFANGRTGAGFLLQCKCGFVFDGEPPIS